MFIKNKLSFFISCVFFFFLSYDQLTLWLTDLVRVYIYMCVRLRIPRAFEPIVDDFRIGPERFCARRNPPSFQLASRIALGYTSRAPRVVTLRGCAGVRSWRQRRRPYTCTYTTCTRCTVRPKTYPTQHHYDNCKKYFVTLHSE